MRTVSSANSIVFYSWASFPTTLKDPLHFFFFCSIYLVHDEVKDKLFEMELSWVCEESGGRHQFVPDALYKEAERYAKAALEEDSSDEDEEM